MLFILFFSANGRFIGPCGFSPLYLIEVGRCVCVGVGGGVWVEWVGRGCVGVLERVYGNDMWLGLGRVD